MTRVDAVHRSIAAAEHYRYHAHADVRHAQPYCRQFRHGYIVEIAGWYRRHTAEDAALDAIRFFTSPYAAAGLLSLRQDTLRGHDTMQPRVKGSCHGS